MLMPSHEKHRKVHRGNRRGIADARNGLGIVFARQRNAEGAIAAWERAHEINPEAIGVVFNLGLAHAHADELAAVLLVEQGEEQPQHVAVAGTAVLSVRHVEGTGDAEAPAADAATAVRSGTFRAGARVRPDRGALLALLLRLLRLLSLRPFARRRHQRASSVWPRIR